MTILARRLLGALLLLVSFLPVFRILDGENDNFRRASVEVAEATLAYVQTAAFMAVLLGVVLAFAVPRARVLPALDRLGRRIESVPGRLWVCGVTATAFALAVAVGAVVYQGLFTNVDEIASFLQARYFAAGTLAGPLPAAADAWLIPNMLTVESGWVSQFPPSHLAILAAGLAVGAPRLVGPVLFAMMAGLAAASFMRLLPARPRVARVAGLAVAVSPFLVLVGAGALSHTSAGAFLWLALWAALRGRDGGWVWSVLAGAAIGVAVCSRPWIGVLLGTLATLGVWLPALLRGRDPRWLAARCAGTVVGGLPFAAALAGYNTRLFGGATTLGYLAAFGERHRLGFHPDPWGNDYTVVDAIGFTSTDLIAFSTQLLETPIPLGVAIGAWLVLARSLDPGARYLLAWALVPVAGNAVYWFHDTRMLYEGAPAWLALGCLALAPLFDGAKPPDGPDPGPDDSARSEGVEDLVRVSRRRRLEPAGVALWTAGVALALAAGIGVPDRVGGFAWDDELLTRLIAPDVPGADASIVFVHTSWNERLSARLQGSGGMRQDSVISLLRRNTNCGLQRYTDARIARARGADVPLPDIDLSQRPGAPADIVRPPAPEGTTLRAREGERFEPVCQRELNADRFGAVALAPLLWQGDLPGLEAGAPLFVRDLGPEANAALLRAWPARTPWVFVPRAADAPPAVVDYDEAMRVLWGAAPRS